MPMCVCNISPTFGERERELRSPKRVCERHMQQAGNAVLVCVRVSAAEQRAKAAQRQRGMCVCSLVRVHCTCTCTCTRTVLSVCRGAGCVCVSSASSAAPSSVSHFQRANGVEMANSSNQFESKREAVNMFWENELSPNETKSNTLSRAKCQVKIIIIKYASYQLMSWVERNHKETKRKWKIAKRKASSHQDYRALGLRKRRSKNENQKVIELCTTNATHNLQLKSYKLNKFI